MSDEVSEDDFVSEIPTSARMLHGYAMENRQAAEFNSKFLGLAGLGGLFFLTSVAIPVEIRIIAEVFDGQPSTTMTLAIYQTILLPATIAFAFVVVASLFRGGSLVKNFLVALLLTAPAPFGFMVAGSAVLDGLSFSDEMVPILVVMYVFYVAVGFVAVAFQLWSRWTLESLDLHGRPVSRAGTRAIELTAVSALICAVGMSVEMPELLTATLVSAALGLFLACAVISFLIGFMAGRKPAMVIAFVILFAAASFLCITMAIASFRWTLSFSNVAALGVSTLLGTTLLLVVMAICVKWLKLCGWRCVK